MISARRMRGDVMAGFIRGRTSDLIALNVQIDSRQFLAEQKKILGEDLPFASALALTTLVKELKKTGEKEIVARYDRPTRWTKNSLFIEPAKKHDYPNQTAAVYFKDEAPKGVPAGRYLLPSIVGKARTHKGFEKALIRAGLMLKEEYAIPGKSIRLNQYGNVSSGTIRKILSQLKAGNSEQFETRDSREAKRGKSGRIGGARYFVPPIKSALPRGIYGRTGRKDPVLLFLFVKDSPDYSVILPFKKLEAAAADRMYRNIWDKSFHRVVAGRRKRRTGN